MKTLILAEKESAAVDIKKGLEAYGSFTKGQRCYESDQYIVTWAQGHLLSMKLPKDYESWGERKWELNALPWYPDNMNFEFQISDSMGASRAFEAVKTHMERSDIECIVSATDAGREGDLIFWEVYDYLGLDVPVKRFFESAVLTPENVQHIFENDLKEESFYLPRREAAYARTYADYLLGMNFTIGFTAKAGVLLSIGRVKTPTMAILAQRRKEIDDFQKETYYEVEADFEGVYKGTWYREQKSQTRMNSKEEAEKLKAKIHGKSGRIVSKEVVEQKQKPGLLFSLTTLQREASKKLGFDPSETLDIAQNLYDKHKVLSYPRSESEVIGSEHVKGLPAILDAVNQEPYNNFAQKVIDNGIQTTKQMVNDKKLTDHHAVIPTHVQADRKAMSKQEEQVYDLVVRRFLAAFYPAAAYEKTDILTEVEGEMFKTAGKIEVDKGWKEIYSEATEEEEEEEGVLPPVEEGEERRVENAEAKQKETKPPKMYNYDSLLGAMANPKKFLSEQQHKDSLEEADAGLGTPATRAAILEDLVKRAYVEKKGKNLDITPTGMKLVEVCPERLRSPEITAEWEGKLRQIELEKLAYDDFMEELQDYIQNIIGELGQTTWEVTFPKGGGTGESIGQCPWCQTEVRDKAKVYECEKHDRENPCLVIFKEIKGKKIPEKAAKELLTKQQSSILKGFKGKNGSFEASLIIKEGGQILFDFTKKEVAVCPDCHKPIRDIGKVYMCETNTKENPCFLLMKTILGKKIPETAVKQLAEKGKTNLIKGFKGKSTFEASLVRKEDGKVDFDFTQEAFASCPVCEKDVYSHGKMYVCESHTKEQRCFYVPKTILKKNISESMVKQIITKGITDDIQGFQGKKGAFTAKLKISEEGGVSLDFTKDTVATCADCSKPVTDRGKVFACESHTKEQTCFYVMKRIAGKEMTKLYVKALAEKGETGEIQGFTSSKGKKFKAKLKRKEDKTIGFEFANKAPASKPLELTCPKCQNAPLQENQKAFGCSGWKEGCRFTVWKNDVVKEKHIREVIDEGKSSVISGMKTKSGSTFDAILVWDEEKNEVKVEKK